MLGKRLIAVLKFCFKQLVLIVVSIVAILSTARMEAYRGPENPAEGAHIFYGYPIAFKECAPGWAWCRSPVHDGFLIDVIIVYAVLAFIFYMPWRRLRRADK